MEVFFNEAATLFKQSASLLEASANACPNAQQKALQQALANHAGLEKALNLAASVNHAGLEKALNMAASVGKVTKVSAPASGAHSTIAVLILLVARMVILCCCAMRQRMSRARQATTPTWVPPSFGSIQGYGDLELGVRSDALQSDALHQVQCESKVPLSDGDSVPLQETRLVRLQAVARGFLARIRFARIRFNTPASPSNSCSEISFDENVEVENEGTNPRPTASECLAVVEDLPSWLQFVPTDVDTFDVRQGLRLMADRLDGGLGSGNMEESLLDLKGLLLPGANLLVANKVVASLVCRPALGGLALVIDGVAAVDGLKAAAACLEFAQNTARTSGARMLVVASAFSAKTWWAQQGFVDEVPGKCTWQELCATLAPAAQQHAVDAKRFSRFLHATAKHNFWYLPIRHGNA